MIKRIGFFEEPDLTLDNTKVTVVTDVTRAVNKRHPLTKLRIIDKIRPQEIELSDYLNEILIRAAHQVLEKIVTKKKVTESVKTNLERISALYGMTGNLHTFLQTPADFCGYRIAPIGSDYISLEMTKVAVTLKNPQIINLYVYHSSNPTEPIKTVALDVPKGGMPQWFVLGEVLRLDFFNLELDRGGYYYVGIKTSELEVGNMLMSRDYKWFDGLVCGSCSPLDKGYGDVWKKYMRLHPVTASVVDEGLQDVEKANNITFGLNMSFNTFCDITQYIVENMSILDEPLMSETIGTLLEEIINSTEVNRIAGVSKSDAELALYGEFSERIREGYNTKMKENIEALSIDLSGFPDICLKCNNKKVRLKWH